MSDQVKESLSPSAARPALVDPFARAVTYLRVSVTDRCDFRCVYCMAENMTFLPKKDLLSLEELDRVCSAFVERGVRKLRITGGEPLVRKNVMSLFESLSRHPRFGRARRADRHHQCFAIAQICCQTCRMRHAPDQRFTGHARSRQVR